MRTQAQDDQAVFDLPAPPCPAWCNDAGDGGWAWIGEDGRLGRGHGVTLRDHVTKVGNEGAAISVYVTQCETRLDDGTVAADPAAVHVESPTRRLLESGVDLTAVQALDLAVSLMRAARMAQLIDGELPADVSHAELRVLGLAGYVQSGEQA